MGIITCIYAINEYDIDYLKEFGIVYSRRPLFEVPTIKSVEIWAQQEYQLLEQIEVVSNQGY